MRAHPLCNTYLAYLSLLEAGLDGIRRRIDSGDPVEANTYHLTEAERKRVGIGKLPTSLREALEAGRMMKCAYEPWEMKTRRLTLN